MKRFALQVLQGCGAFALTRAISAKMPRILMYHNFSRHRTRDAAEIDLAAARSQFEYLRSHFNVVPLTQLVDRLSSQKPLGHHIVALTIDDGRRNCYELFFPLLREFGIPATFFVVSSFISGEDWVWTDKVLWLSEQPSPVIELTPGKIDGLFAALNQMRPEIRNAEIENLAARMGINLPKEPPRKYQPCSWTELREMADSGLVEIGSHTVNHPILATLTDQESWQELILSRAQIEAGLGKEVKSFCFPNGKAVDYHASQVQQVRDAGYVCAVVTSFGMVSPASDLYQLPRIGISGHSDQLIFRKYLDGMEHCQHKLLPSLRRHRT